VHLGFHDDRLPRPFAIKTANRHADQARSEEGHRVTEAIADGSGGRSLHIPVRPRRSSMLGSVPFGSTRPNRRL
jgi:hypothetical protein